MALLMPVCFTFLLAGTVLAAETIHPLSDEFISLSNSKQNSWIAGRNFPLDTPLSYIKKLSGVINPMSSLPRKIYNDVGELPENFDPREKWPDCPSLNEINDQGECGSSWAFGAVEAMTDRVCIYSNGTKHFHFSADDLLTCCENCCLGCYVGEPGHGWDYWRDIGLVSGGPYNSSKGCRPYEIPPCEHFVKGKRPKCHGLKKIPACNKKCQSGYGVEYDKDKRRGKSVYSLQSESEIMKELYEYGPGEASLDLYEDFLNYKSGVYSHVTGDFIDAQFVKLMGWGVENGKKYWLCANSWNTDWGDRGFFKILRGVNECNIETYGMLAGEPDLSGL